LRVNQKQKTKLIEMVDHIIERLNQPLPQSELEFGWNEEERLFWRAFFEKMQWQLVDDTLWDNPELEAYVVIWYGMDHHGIVDGDILEEAVGISAEMRKATSKRWWPF
jgi:hypothetical protein